MTLRIKVDYTKQLSEEPNVGHNRWHPNIQPIVEVEPSEEVGIETRDAFDGQLSSASTADDIPTLDLNLVHPLTGPVYVKGAQAGDLLQIDILEVTTGDWGYTIQVPGFGFLRDVFPESQEVVEIALKISFVSVESSGSDDDACVFGWIELFE